MTMDDCKLRDLDATRGMSSRDIAKAMRVSNALIYSIEMRALTKFQILWMGEDLDDGTLTDRRELRRLVALIRNLRRAVPRHPLGIVAA